MVKFYSLDIPFSLPFSLQGTKNKTGLKIFKFSLVVSSYCSSAEVVVVMNSLPIN